MTAAHPGADPPMGIHPGSGLGPGVYDGVPEAAYHADPVEGGSLSSSGARKLIEPYTPADFHYELTHPQAPSDAMQFGTAVHRLVLEDGRDVVRAEDWKTWRSDAAAALRAKELAAGRVALLADDHDRAKACRDAIRSHRLAGRLLDPHAGRSEVTVVWRDQATGVMCRCRFDYLSHGADGRGVLVAVDIKTSGRSLTDDGIAKTVNDYHYDHSWAHYTDGALHAAAELGAPAVELLFVFVHSEPPHHVRVVDLDERFRRLGRARHRLALSVFAECVESGEWPGHPDGVTRISPPNYAKEIA